MGVGFREDKATPQLEVSAFSFYYRSSAGTPHIYSTVQKPGHGLCRRKLI